MSISIDFETRSTVNLPKTTTEVYASDPSTDVWCMAWAVDEDDVQLWTPGDSFPELLCERIEQGETLWAWNCSFERAIWEFIMVPRYGWPAVPGAQWRDPMAMAYAMSLPGNLAGASAALGIDQQKDAKGERLMLSMCKPRRVDPDGTIVWWEDSERKHNLGEYCRQDVRTERATRARLVNLPETEWKTWHLDQEINRRGIPVDLESIDAMIALVESEKKRLDREMKHVTGGMVKQCTWVSVLTDWLRFNGVETPGVAKADLRALLAREDLSPPVRRALELRQEAAKSSTAKLETMRRCASADGRVKGTMQYHGSSTGRWAGRKIQPVNYPWSLPVEDMEEAIDLVHRGERDLLELMYGNPMEVASKTLRGMIAAPPGREFTCSDFSNIEGRALAWLAGERWKLDAFRAFDAGEGPDLYKVAFSKSFGTPIDRVTKDQRQIGKVQELACLAADTLVVTDAGLKQITEVQLTDKLWSGHQWVNHAGLVARGVKQVVRAAGIEATPDHLMLTGRTWKPAQSIASSKSMRYQALVTGSENLPSWVSSDGYKARACRTWSEPSAHAMLSRISCSRTIFIKAYRHVVGPALGRRQAIGASTIGGTLTSAPMMITENDCSTASRRASTAATTQTTPGTPAMVGAVYACTNLGGRTAGRFSHIWSRFLDGMTRHWTLIGRMSTEGTNPATCVSSPDARTAVTSALSRICKSRSKRLRPVYDIANAGPDNRFTVIGSDGPVIVHNCGYEGGVGAFETMAKGFGIDMGERYDQVVEAAPSGTVDQAMDAWEQRGKGSGVPMPRWVASEVVKLLWREAHPRTTAFWKSLQYAALKAAENPGQIFDAGRHVRFKKAGSFLFCRLPSGRCLCYPYPEIHQRETPWGSSQPKLTYMGVNSLTRKWERQDTYGGKLAENVTQAAARDVLRDAMLRLTAAGIEIVFTVHDEIVAEGDTGAVSLDEFNRIMAETPAWAPGLPIAVEGWQGRRYRK